MLLFHTEICHLEDFNLIQFSEVLFACYSKRDFNGEKELHITMNIFNNKYNCHNISVHRLHLQFILVKGKNISEWYSEIHEQKKGRDHIPAVRNISCPSSAGFFEPETGAYRKNVKT